MAGLASHVRSHRRGQEQTSGNVTLPERPVGYLCDFCDKVCKSVTGVKHQMIVRGYRQVSNTVNTDKLYVFHECKKCKSEADKLMCMLLSGKLDPYKARTGKFDRQ